MTDTANPHVGVVADLLNPYMSYEAKQKAGGYSIGGCELAFWWLRTHPGRWALVGVGPTGVARQRGEDAGFRIGTRCYDGVTYYYAQVPHPEAETLTQALKRTPPRDVDPPMLTTSDFNWTPEELAEACQVAREDLGQSPGLRRRLHLFPSRRRR